MTRNRMLIVLLLGILMPLQVAAEAWLSASPCPDQMTMDATSNESMPCCPDQDDTDKANPCQTAKTCHLCKTPAQIYLPVSSVLGAGVDISLSLKSPLLNFTAKHPASIWRPPSIS